MNKMKLSRFIQGFETGKGRPSDFWILPHFKGGAIYMVLASLAINLLSLALPLTMMQVYDRIVPYKALGTLTWLVVAATTAVIFESILRYARGWISNWMAFRFEHYLNLSAMERILTCRIESYETNEPGVYLDRLAAVGKLRNFYAGQLFLILLDIPFAGLFLWGIWFLAKDLVWFPVGLIFIFWIIASLLRYFYGNVRGEQLKLNDRRFNFLFEILNASHQIKSLTLEEQMLRRYERLQGNLAEENLKAAQWSSLPSSLGGFFSQLSLFGMVAIGAGAVMQGDLSLGGLTACAMLGGRALQPILVLAGFWIRYSEARLAVEQLSGIAKLKPSFIEGAPVLPNNLRGSLSLEGVNFRYRQDQPLLVENFDLFIEEKEMVCINGENPAETTALLLLMIGALTPEAGEIMIDDYKIGEWDLSSAASAIQYVPQSGVLFGGSLLDNLTLFDRNRNSIALDTSALLGLDEQVSNLPLGYETQVKSGVRQSLPASLVQRICMARALVNRPRILLLDNSFAAMDQETNLVMQALLKKLKGLTTIVIVSSQPAVVNMADRCLIMKEGKAQEVQTTNMLI